MGNSFAQIIGHDRALEVLAKSLENDRLAHAYLFVGIEGLGRTLLAHTLIREFLGVQTGALLHTHPDAIWLEREVDEDGKRKAEIGVDAAREFVDRFAMSPIAGNRKTAFVEEAERLSTPAANALLKTIEEPKGDTLLILRASSVDAVPRTIASRCQVIRFAPVPTERIAEALRKRGSDGEEAQTCAIASLGRPGFAIRLITDTAFRATHELSQERLRSWRMMPVYERLRSVADLLPKDEADKRSVLEEILDGLERATRTELLRAADASPAELPYWTAVVHRVSDARSGVQHNVNPLLCLEHVVLAL